MKRADQLSKLNKTNEWDIIIIGGGASGLGTALDAALRGYKILLVEASDFAKGTSSRSTKLVHGGVRYLAQGNIKLVKEALRERGLLAQNAPHLFKNQSFIIPNYSLWNGFFYYFGLSIYDFLAGKLSIGKTKFLSAKSTSEHLSTLDTTKLKSGVLYHDGQFDDARLAINLAQSAIENGGTILNYCKVNKLTSSERNLINGIEFTDQISGKQYTVKGKVIINATGVFTDEIMSMEDKNHLKTVVASQGIHLVFDKSFLPGTSALMLPKTSDGRVLFAVPWHNKVIVGTTDVLIEKARIEPIASQDEIDFIFENINHYFKNPPTKNDVLAVFAGLRPLAAPKDNQKNTKEVSRSHKIITSKGGLISIVGGKWTTYRQMAEEIVNQAISLASLPQKNCVTQDFKIHGYQQQTIDESKNPIYFYGSDQAKIQQLQDSNSELGKKIHPNYDYTFAQVLWAMENEMAETVEDILARRIRLLFLDTQSAIDSVARVAEFMANHLGKNENWAKEQTAQFLSTAKNYLLVDYTANNHE
ncbi:MAG: glycerol-3-phosphate dehydrogenase/oxidase [Bacteroidota bacterium]